MAVRLRPPVAVEEAQWCDQLPRVGVVAVRTFAVRGRVSLRTGKSRPSRVRVELLVDLKRTLSASACCRSAGSPPRALVNTRRRARFAMTRSSWDAGSLRQDHSDGPVHAARFVAARVARAYQRQTRGTQTVRLRPVLFLFRFMSRSMYGIAATQQARQRCQRTAADFHVYTQRRGRTETNAPHERRQPRYSALSYGPARSTSQTTRCKRLRRAPVLEPTLIPSARVRNRISEIARAALIYLRGSLVPSALSILLMICPFGIALPLSYWLITAGFSLMACASLAWVMPFAVLACWIALPSPSPTFLSVFVPGQVTSTHSHTYVVGLADGLDFAGSCGQPHGQRSEPQLIRARRSPVNHSRARNTSLAICRSLT